MYSFNCANAMECSKNIVLKKATADDLEKRLSVLTQRLENIPDSDSIRIAVNRARQAVSEQKEKLCRIEYVLSSAAEIYKNSDRKGLEIFSGSDPRTFVYSMTKENNEMTGQINMPVSIEIR